MTHFPIRIRLALAFSVVMALVLAATGIVVYVRVADAVDRTLDAELRSRAARDAIGLRNGALPRLVRSTDAGDETLTQVLGSGGQLIGSNDEDWQRPALNAQAAASLTAGGVLFDASPPDEPDERWRLLAVPLAERGSRFVVVVGKSREDHDEALASLRTELLIGGPIALLLASLAGYRLARAALRPVESMRQRAAEISASTPRQRLPVPRSHDEVSRLGETLNGMLDRLEAGLAHERAFVADASHQLRTPLARLKVDLEVAAQRRRSPEEYEDLLHAAIQETDRLAQLARDLLALARAEQGEAPRRSAIRVGTVFTHLADRFATRAKAEGRRVEIGDGTHLTVVADEVQLEHALGNLVDNALRYGTGPVRLSARERQTAVELHVTDDGPGFPDAFLPRAFDRFSRADPSRDDGSGLGLAIVQMIAQAHDGTATIRNRPDAGVDVSLAISAGSAGSSRRLPSEPQADAAHRRGALATWFDRHRPRVPRVRGRPTAR